MVEPAIADPATEFNCALPIPPLDPAIFSDEFSLPDNFLSFDDQDFDITFDDLLYLPPAEDLINRNHQQVSSDDHQADYAYGYCNDSSPESSAARVWSSQSEDVSVFLNFPSPESGKPAPRVANCVCPSSESENDNQPASSQGSGNGSEGVLNDHSPSPDSPGYSSARNNKVNVADDQKIKLEEELQLGNNPKRCLLKRKKENGGNVNISQSRGKNNKYDAQEEEEEEDEKKKKARLIRNRESAQLSRQRKKHYVEELEDKVRAMHSTIQDLNAKISYIVAENASLRQQMVAGSGGGAAVCPPPPVMYPPPYPPPMGYPWMPYVVKPQGSQVPLVPIPRLKPQNQTAVSASKAAKKVESKKKAEGGGKTKKVASVSFLGLIFFIMLFGGFVPMANNVKYAGSNYINSRFSDYQQHHGRVLTVRDHVNGTTNCSLEETFPHEKFHIGGESNSNVKGQNGVRSTSLPASDDFVRPGNSSSDEPLVASLFVPRNDKLVKIDGNLIIHSVLASEKAMATSREDPRLTTSTNTETGLAVALNLAPAISIHRQPHLYGRSSTGHQRAIASDEENLKKSKGTDGKLQQWFREGLAGPMLTSGMCTEVFRFDVSAASSAAGAIIPATQVRNITAEHSQNSTYLNKVRNRRILHGLPIPLPGTAENVTKEHVESSSSEKERSHKNTNVSSMIVSVLVDPREAGDGEGDGVMGPKSFSRIFVVVLLDSVKYVTYSCMLPLKGSGHLVTT